MPHRKLRIAWTIGWALLTLLLAAMWVRSYCYLESVPSSFGNVATVRGTIIVTWFDFAYAWNHDRYDWAVDQNTPWKWSHDGPMRRWPPIRIYRTTNGVPRSEFDYWFLTPFAALIAAAVWTRKLGVAFSVRTLLIATTLVAAGLGWIVHSLR